MPSPALWDRLAPKWDALLADATSFANREEGFRRFHWFLKKTIRPGNRTKTCRLLDLGCGTGEAGWPLWKRVASVTFLDRSPAMLRFARNKYPKGIFVRGDASDLPFLEAEFDIAVSRGALVSQLEPADAEACLKQVWRSLRPQGLFLFDFVANRERWSEPCGATGEIPPAVGSWTRAEMEALLKAVLPGATFLAWDGIEKHALNRVLLRKT